MKRACALLVLVLAGCRPDFEDDPALVVAPRILAVKSEPAEAKPGASEELSALIALPTAADGGLAPEWSFCLAPKSVAEDNVVSTACLGALARVGEGSRVTAVLPSNGCSLFGPNPPPGGFRPRDPDATGGYFQPLRVDLPGADPLFHLARLSCQLGSASADIATAFAAAYVQNQNPKLLPLSATTLGASVDLGAVPRGAHIELDAAWTADDAESYAYFDRASQAILTRREAMSVAWYVSAGKLALESSGRAETDPALDAANTWVAPNQPATAHLWVILRDSRGGTDFATYDLVVP